MLNSVEVPNPHDSSDLVLRLVEKLISTVRDSGANHMESLCALKAAADLLPALRLDQEPTLRI